MKQRLYTMKKTMKRNQFRYRGKRWEDGCKLATERKPNDY